MLAVDPSSTRTGGSILGDKTRMARLAVDPTRLHPPLARPPARSAASRRRPARPCCCARPPGFDVILVETVGVGQSETAVADMTDFFLVLMLPGAGDELQGIKKGVLELADMIAVNKADGDNVKRAQRRRRRIPRRAAHPDARARRTGRRRSCRRRPAGSRSILPERSSHPPTRSCRSVGR